MGRCFERVRLGKAGLLTRQGFERLRLKIGSRESETLAMSAFHRFASATLMDTGLPFGEVGATAPGKLNMQGFQKSAVEITSLLRSALKLVARTGSRRDLPVEITSLLRSALKRKKNYRSDKLHALKLPLY